MPTLTRSCKAWQGLARYGDSVQPGQEDVFLVGPSSTLPERVFPAKVSRDLVDLVSLLLPCKALQDSTTFADERIEVRLSHSQVTGCGEVGSMKLFNNFRRVLEIGDWLPCPFGLIISFPVHQVLEFSFINT